MNKDICIIFLKIVDTKQLDATQFLAYEPYIRMFASGKTIKEAIIAWNIMMKQKSQKEYVIEDGEKFNNIKVLTGVDFFFFIEPIEHTLNVPFQKQPFIVDSEPSGFVMDEKYLCIRHSC